MSCPLIYLYKLKQKSEFSLINHKIQQFLKLLMRKILQSDASFGKSTQEDFFQNKIKAVSNLRAISDSVKRPFTTKIFQNKISLMTSTTTKTITKNFARTTKFMSNLTVLHVSFWCNSHHHPRHEWHRVELCEWVGLKVGGKEVWVNGDMSERMSAGGSSAFAFTEGEARQQLFLRGAATQWH